MCEYCIDPAKPVQEELKRRRETANHYAECLRTVARYYEDLGRGVIKPHDGVVIDRIRPHAKSALRELFEAWV